MVGVSVDVTPSSGPPLPDSLWNCLLSNFRAQSSKWFKMSPEDLLNLWMTLCHLSSAKLYDPRGAHCVGWVKITSSHIFQMIFNDLDLVRVCCLGSEPRNIKAFIKLLSRNISRAILKLFLKLSNLFLVTMSDKVFSHWLNPKLSLCPLNYLTASVERNLRGRWMDLNHLKNLQPWCFYHSAVLAQTLSSVSMACGRWQPVGHNSKCLGWFSAPVLYLYLYDPRPLIKVSKLISFHPFCDPRTEFLL